MTGSSCSISQKSNKSKEEEEILDQLAPDGGWGWMVCFGSFMVNFIADGTMFSFGILFLDLLDYFKDSKFKTSIVGSSQLGLSMMMGPVVSILLKNFSCRQVTIIGGLISTASMILSIFSWNVEIMIITYGIMCGAGMCMMYMTSIIVVGLHFHKRRAIATGIATSGAGVGVFAYGYLMDYLLQIYDWKGAVLILSGLMFNCVVCGALYRPVKPMVSKEKNIEYNSSSASSGYCGSGEEPGDRDPTNNPVKTDVPVVEFHDDNLNENKLYIKNKPLVQHKPKFKSAEDISLLSVKEVDPRLHSSSYTVSKLKPDTKTEKIAMGLRHPMLRKDIFYSGSISQLPDYDACGGSMTSFLAQMTRNQSISTDNESHITRSKCGITSLFDASLFKDWIFWALLLACTFWTVQSITITYVPSLAVSNGIDRSQAALLISIIGISNTVGRILAGFANDVLKIRSIVMYFIAFCLGTISNFILPFCEIFSLIASCTAIFGICMAVAVSMRTIVLADLMRIERLTQSFGFISFAQGAAFIVNPPIAGKLLDVTETYIAPFFMAASFYLLSAILCLIIIIAIRRPQRASQNSETESWL